MVAPTPEATETAAQSDTLMSWADLLAMERAEPQAVHAYGELEQQVIDIWLPEGEGPHPVVLMVHGGCWQKAIANRTLMNYMAEALRQRGLAVWNVEYRGLERRIPRWLSRHIPGCQYRSGRADSERPGL